MFEHLRFCRHGWVRAEYDFGRCERHEIELVDERLSGVKARAYLWPQESIKIEPYLVISTIGPVEQWLTPKGGRVMAHARFFPLARHASLFANERPLDQRNFIVDLTAPPLKKAVNFLDGAPFPMPDIEPEPAFLVMNIYLDRWAQTELEWFSMIQPTMTSFHNLSGITGGCLLRCGFAVSEDFSERALIDAWLYSEGLSDQARWPIYPWPSQWPPPIAGVN